ncbi:MAG: gyrase inhibitor YacG [Hyphomicrobiales bacterium]|nr:gyrase inhibitor YacG [Hyphomicrobiales bacterium]
MPASANDNSAKRAMKPADMPDANEPTGRPCATCGKPAIKAYHPFCSKRCADVDLGRWLTGSYAVPVAPNPDEDSDEDETRADGE